VREAGVLNYCLIHDNSSAILFAQDVNNSTIYDVCYPYSGFDPTYHWNGFYMDNANGNAGSSTINCYLRNSCFYNVGGGANMAYPNVEAYNCYIYNNVLYGTMSSQLAVEVETYDYGYTGVMKSCYVYNNTIVNYSTNTAAVHVVQRPGLQVGNLFVVNNHIIGPGTPALTDATGTTVSNLLTVNNVIMTSSQAAAQGYTLSNLYAPPSPASPTCGQGTNITGMPFRNDIRNHYRPNVSWDVGAYQYLYVPSPPANLHVVTAQ
jgi:hypothetical protein